MSPDSLPIAFQGAPGAYSDMACRDVFPGRPTLPCESFETAFEAVREGRAGHAMIPIDNSVAGRVADVHHFLPQAGLHIVAEHFQRVNHCLLGMPGARIEDIKEVHSHIHALPQCRRLIQELGAKPIVSVDTAGAARIVADKGDPAAAAIASSLAADIYGLHVLRADIEDAEHNTTRFLVMAREPIHPEADNGPCITSFVFRVRSVPAALYKALGGFATNGINMTKLESYIIDAGFTVAQFYADIEGHPDDRLVRLALEELGFFSKEVNILGVYPASPFRQRFAKA